jgi:hypothetical protein
MSEHDRDTFRSHLLSLLKSVVVATAIYLLLICIIISLVHFKNVELRGRNKPAPGIPRGRKCHRLD